MSDEIKLNKRKLSGTEKTFIALACILFVLIVVSFTGTIIKSAAKGTNAASLSPTTVNELLYKLMPKEVEGAVTIDNVKHPVTFYLERNESFDPETDEGINYYNVYYLDDNGNRVNTDEEGNFESGVPETKFMVIFGFVGKAMEKIDKIVDVMRIIRIVMIILFVLDLIALWFTEFSISEDQKKAQYQKQPKKHRK